MKISREILTKAGVCPKLQLGTKGAKGVQSTGPHRVRMVEDKIVVKLDADGQKTHYVRYIVEENGKQYQYDTRMKVKEGTDVSYLVQALADVDEGEEITLEMKKSGIKNYVEVTRHKTGERQAVADEETADEDEQAGGDLADELATIHA